MLRILETERSIRVFQSFLKKYSLVLYQFEGGFSPLAPPFRRPWLLEFETLWIWVNLTAYLHFPPCEIILPTLQPARMNWYFIFF